VIAAAPLTPERTALLMIGAEKYLSRRPPAGPLPALNAAAALLRHARRAGVHVLHVRRILDGQPAPEVRLRPPGADPRRGAAVAGEAVLDVRGPSPFADTPLDEDLSARGVEAVIVAGVMTPTSCTATANEAIARRYRTVVASDLVHESARESKRRLGAEVLSTNSIRGLLQETASAA
jgi:nicotinamidase-related amidase